VEGVGKPAPSFFGTSDMKLHPGQIGRSLIANTRAGAGSSFSYRFPGTPFTFAPAAPQTGGQFGFQFQHQPGVSYCTQNSASLRAWTAVSNNRLTDNALNLTIQCQPRLPSVSGVLSGNRDSVR